MNEDRVMHDGYVRQHELQSKTPWRQNGEFQMFYPVEAVVIDVIYPDDDRSLSKRCVEYTLAVLGIDGIPYLKNVIFPGGFNYYGDGVEEVLRAASKASDPASPGRLGDEQTLDYQNTDGDRVLVHFIQGAFTRPVITAKMPHPGNPQRSISPFVKQPLTQPPKISNSHTQKSMCVNGTRLDIDDQGNVIVTPLKHPVDTSTGDKKKITFRKSDGSTTVLELTNVGGSWAINFGPGATEPIVLGNALVTFLDTMIGTINTNFTTLATAVSAVGALLGPPTGSPGVPVVTVAPIPPTVPSSVATPTPSILSDWVKSQKGVP